MTDTVAEYYENDPEAMIWRTKEDREAIGRYVGYCIASEIGIPRAKEGKAIILSTASNAGIMERGIQQEAGEGFSVIANDFANIPRVKGPLALQSDARELPFSDGSIACIVDIAGALWHQLVDDKLGSPSVRKELSRAGAILKHYLSKLTANGVLITDDGYEKSTGVLLDGVFKGGVVPGFDKPEVWGDESYKLRVYRKAKG